MAILELRLLGNLNSKQKKNLSLAMKRTALMKKKLSNKLIKNLCITKDAKQIKVFLHEKLLKN